MSRNPAPDHCAICGAEIPHAARACPECGADERTGWREQSLYDGLDLPADEPEGKRPGSAGAIFWKVTGLVLLVVLSWQLLRHWL